MKNLILIGFVFVIFIANTLAANAQIINDGPTIDRPKDGIHYEVQSTKYVYHPCACCGYNDIAFPNDGKFEVEVRRYYVLKDGKEVDVWFREIEIKWTGECRE